MLAEALYTASNDVARVQSLLPELSPADRCALLHHRSILTAEGPRPTFPSPGMWLLKWLVPHIRLTPLDA